MGGKSRTRAGWQAPPIDITARGFTLIELLMVMATIAVLVSLMLPHALSARKGANEASAISTLRTLAYAQCAYKTQNLGGSGQYGTIAQLETPPRGTTYHIQWPTAGVPIKSGYRFSDLEPPTLETWCIVAVPITAGVSGDRYFGVTVDAQVRESTAPATNRADVLSWPVVDN
jgi:prepilin-type N-terminal cleavage/methylation domain-containing protein